METGTKEKSANLSKYFTLLPTNYTLKVDVSVQKEMNRFIPFSIELLESVGIPPIFIKLPKI